MISLARAHHVVTTAFALIGAVLGYVIAAWSATLLTITSDTINTVFLTLSGLGTGFLIGHALRSRTQNSYQRLKERLDRIPSEVVISGVLGATIGLIVAVLLNTFLAQVPGFAWWHGLITGLISLVTSTSLTVAHRSAFTTATKAGPKPEILLDTSAIIDGRIQNLLPALLPGQSTALSTPLLDELQILADSPSPNRRARGLRGLANLENLKEAGLELAPLRDELPASLATDVALAELATQHDATLVTVDFPLTKAARLRGANVLNLNELAHALRPHYAVGDTLTIHLESAGNEPDQAVGNLNDGSLVVVKRGVKHVGNTRQVRIQNVLERPSGRIIFAEDAGSGED